ncbi:glycerophosphoryl diester phosphodiesterase [Fluviispira multicolorata]|uniref:Glycerophosphoryl diester phosphodiesterase n=1 Tax=Fluviispira multicolorata TaxID=2654512 RepID=A0A833JDW5_9BACT|nr:glycerophosphoryl diester phosphodiesterase [Fluviispira multicolorata]KAB8030962.1 glycerophosphoryl diester phosphodiesterase [Fluviispira multicolorata]
MLSSLKIPRIIGHRGAKGYAPENTLSSFRKAKELGATWVEFDVKETEDGILVIMHDDDLDRTTNGKGPMAKTPWTVVNELDAGAWFDQAFSGEKIPTFDETILLLKELKLGANIEIKPCPNRDERTAVAIANAIAKKWPKELPQPLVSSFSMDSLRTAKRTHPDLIIGALFETLPSDWKKIAKEVQAQTINLDQDIVTLEMIKEINNEGYPVLTYTVNDKKRAYDLFNMGVHSIFTDYPWKE